MKILISCDEHCFKLNGKYYASEYTHTLLNRYMSAFESITVIVRVKYIGDLKDAGIHNILFDDGRLTFIEMPFFQGPSQYIKKIFEVRKIASKAADGVNLAIVRLPSTIGFVVCKELQKKKIPYATELVLDCKDCYENESNIISKYIWYNFHRKQVKACYSAIGIAPVTESYMQKHYRSKVPDCVNSYFSSIEMLESSYTSPRKYPQKTMFELVHAAKQIQYGGRKGHDDLILAAKKLKDMGSPIKIHFVGSDYFGSIKKYEDFAKQHDAIDSIVFEGFLNKPQMEEMIRKSDIAILPTKGEGLPRVLIEAMAMGLPCITTNVSGNPELVDEEFLFNYGDIDAIVNAIVKLQSSPELYEKVSRVNFERSKKYSKNILDSRRKKFYIDLLKKVKSNDVNPCL